MSPAVTEPAFSEMLNAVNRWKRWPFASRGNHVLLIVPPSLVVTLRGCD